MATSPAQFFTSVEWIPPEAAIFGRRPKADPTPFDAPSSGEMFEMMHNADCIQSPQDWSTGERLW